MEGCRNGAGGLVPGVIATLAVVRMGEMLATLDGVPGAEKLIEKIRAGDIAARAELMAVYLLRHGRPHVTVELYPRIAVGAGERESDFRLREAQEPWTYVEVTRPDMADAQRRASAVLQRLTQVVSSV